MTQLEGDKEKTYPKSTASFLGKNGRYSNLDELSTGFLGQHQNKSKTAGNKQKRLVRDINEDSQGSITEITNNAIETPSKKLDNGLRKSRGLQRVEEVSEEAIYPSLLEEKALFAKTRARFRAKSNPDVGRLLLNSKSRFW